MEVVTAPSGAPLSLEPSPRLSDYPPTHWMKEVPLPASLLRWATAAASLITAFSAWTRRYFAFPVSLSLPSSFQRAERRPEPAPLSLSPACVCTCLVGEHEAALTGSRCRMGAVLAETPGSPILCSALHNCLPAVSDVTVAFSWNRRALLQHLEIQTAKKSLEYSYCILMYLRNLRRSSGEFRLARRVSLGQLVTLKVCHPFWQTASILVISVLKVREASTGPVILSVRVCLT